MFDGHAEVFAEPCRDNRAMAGLWIALDAEQGGAKYVDQPVVTDGNLVSARIWQDNTPFMKKFIEMLKAAGA